MFLNGFFVFFDDNGAYLNFGKRRVAEFFEFEELVYVLDSSGVVQIHDFLILGRGGTVETDV